MREEGIPFIGDLCFMDKGVFGGSCISGNLSVSDLNIQDNVFEVELNLRSAIQKDQLNQEGAHVIIGIDIEIITREGTTLPGTLRANMLHGRPETVNFPVGFSFHQGKVKIVKFNLIPIQLINILENDFSGGKNLNFDQSYLENISVFQEYKKCWEELSELLEDEDKLMVMPFKEKQKLKSLGQVMSGLGENFTIDCFNLLQEWDSKNWYLKVYDLMERIDHCRQQIEATNTEINNFHVHSKGKELFLGVLRQMGITYIADTRQFQQHITGETVFSLFFCEQFVKNNQNYFRETLTFLKTLIEKSEENEKDQEFIAVDLDVIQKNELRIPLPKKVAIYHFSGKDIKSLDFKGDLEKKQSINSARCKKRGEENEPRRRGKFIMPCPNSIRGECERDYHEWTCVECETFLEYGFNNCLYCACADGKGTLVDNFEFMCTDFKHGFEYVRYHPKCNEFFDEMKPLKNITVIILGPSGVGKSTWINGIVNYMQYNDINIAKKSKILTAIATQFTVTDQYYQSKVIRVGSDENEDTASVGVSGTQDCKTYCIRYKDFNVQLIDTPGLGDSRGIEQDKKNVKKILDHIRHFEEIHGICILLKPNESKIGVLMRFCIKEILTHLHKSCANNIVYCFTNARATFYRPGDTLPVLRKLLEEIQVFMPLDKNTIYCFDNEAYRYLCTFNAKGIKYTPDDEKSFSESWDKSVEETKRLFECVSKLQPHKTQETMTLNQSRRMILSLTRPIADITHNIEMNIQIVSDHKTLIESMDEKDRDLLKQLYVPQVTLENVPLGYPRTVCTADRCVEYHVLPDSGVKLTEYVQHCHPHCYLQGVTPEQYPNPDLKHCAAMSGSSGGEWCHACKCPWKTHMHILYDQRRTEIRVKNQSVEANVGSKKDLRKQKEQAIDDLEQRIASLKDEKKKIIKIAGKFAYFLKKHAITPYNDCFCDYLDYLIDHEEGKRYKTEKEKSILDNLKKTKATYEQEIQFLETAMANSADTEEYDPKDVKKWEEELYQLPIHGKQLKDNMKVVIDAEDNAARYSQKNLTATKSFTPSSNTGILSTMVGAVKNWNPFGKGTKNNHQKGVDDYRYNSSNQASGYSYSYNYSTSNNYNANPNYNYNSSNKKSNFDNDDWYVVKGRGRGKGGGGGGGSGGGGNGNKKKGKR